MYVKLIIFIILQVLTILENSYIDSYWALKSIFLITLTLYYNYNYIFMIYTKKDKISCHLSTMKFCHLQSRVLGPHQLDINYEGLMITPHGINPAQLAFPFRQQEMKGFYLYDSHIKLTIHQKATISLSIQIKQKNIQTFFP